MAAIGAILRSIIMILLLLLLLLSTAWCNPNAHVLEDEEDFFSTDKEVAVNGVPDQSMASRTQMKGRKMKLGNKVIIKMVEIRGKGAANGETVKVSRENQAVFMASEPGNKDNNNKNDKKNKKKVGAAINGGNVHKRRISHLPDKKMKNEEAASGFVAFNADYHAPRHHPPKNN